VKAELITWLATLQDDSPYLQRVEALRRGGQPAMPEEPWLTLKEIAESIRKHPTWLGRLGVPEQCGEYFCGRRRYQRSKVESYLSSEVCRARIVELRAERQAKVAKKTLATRSPINPKEIT
jgi:hypothetical protein